MSFLPGAVRRTTLVLATAGALTLGLGATAQAATLCVQMPAPTACDATYLTLQGAIDAAQSAYPATRDTIRVGPLTLPPEAAEAFTANQVDIVGSGVGATTLQSPSAVFSGAPALTLNGTSTVTDLSIRIKDILPPPGPPPNISYEAGLDLGAGTSASRISITAEPGMDNATGVYVREGSTLRDASITVELGLANNAISAAAGAVIEDVSFFSDVGVDARDSGDPVTIRRLRATAPVREAVRAGSGAAVDISDSLLLVQEHPSAVGLGTSGSTTATITARNVTVIGSGTGAGVEVDIPGGTIDLRDSIVRGTATSLKRRFAGTPTINVSYSSFDPAAIDETGATAGGSIVQGEGNLNVDPLFVDASAGDYRLPATSPLVDMGFPGGGPSTLDLAGLPRVADGDGDGSARRDIGAYEYQPPPVVQPPPDVVRPVLSGLKLAPRAFRVGKKATARSALTLMGKPKVPQRGGKRRVAPVGTKVRYRLSEAATVTFSFQRVLPGRRTRVKGRSRCVKPTLKLTGAGAKRCPRYKAVRRGTLTRSGKKGANSFAFSGRIGKRKLAPGRYRVHATARDSAGNATRKPKFAKFRVLR